jgi:DNA-binding NarL/FixJ family response regulator
VVRILLCDDASEMRSLLRWAFEQGDGLEIVGEAADSEQALALAVDAEPDVIILDLQMPELAPDALLRAIAQVAPGTPIVTFSGYEPDLVAPAEARLVALHIPKTTDLSIVRQAVIDLANGAG